MKFYRQFSSPSDSHSSVLSRKKNERWIRQKQLRNRESIEGQSILNKEMDQVVFKSVASIAIDRSLFIYGVCDVGGGVGKTRKTRVIVRFVV